MESEVGGNKIMGAFQEAVVDIHPAIKGRIGHKFAILMYYHYFLF